MTTTLGAKGISNRGFHDFLIEVQKGTVTGHTVVHKFGRNDAVPNGTWAFVSLLGHTAWPLSAATTVRVKAGNAADTAAGNGAREITVQGVDSSFNETSETLATAGESASASTTTSFWRVHRTWVSAVGVYGAANTAAVVIENTAGDTDLIKIGIEEGQSQFGAWSVPNNKVACLLGATVTVDALKPADVRFSLRNNFDDTTAPMSSRRIQNYWDGLSGVFNFLPMSPGPIISNKADLWFEARGSGAGTEVSVDFEMLVVDL